MNILCLGQVVIVIIFVDAYTSDRQTHCGNLI